MTNQADRAINITIKEVELVEVGKEKHDETLAKIETKADKTTVDSLKNTVNENQTQLQEQLQSQSEIINTKLDETQVKALIAEAELDDLTLEQVQQEVIRQVADKASTQAVIDANQAQDAKMDEFARLVEQQQAEVIEKAFGDDDIYIDQTNVGAWDGRSPKLLRIGDYYVPFFTKEPFRVKKEVFDVIVAQGEPKMLELDELVDFGGRRPSYLAFTSSDDRVTADIRDVTIITDEAFAATITSPQLDKPITLNITVSETEEQS